MLGIFVKFVILLVALRTLKTPSYLCEFNDNEILSPYAKGVYSYYDIEKIKEFVVLKGAHEVASLIEKYDFTLSKSKNSIILKYSNENFAHNVYVQEFIERMTASCFGRK